MVIAFLSRFPMIHRVVHRFLARGKPYETPDGYVQFPSCSIDRLVWNRLMRKPHFSESVFAGIQDFKEGRTVRYHVTDDGLERDA